MPKQLYKITQFHGGLNSNSDARDIAENELSDATDVMVDELGKIRMMGGTSTSSMPAANAAAIIAGYGLFQFSHDRIGGQFAAADLAGTHTGADSDTVLIDSAAAFTSVLVGARVDNTTDGSHGTVASVDSPTQLTLDDLIGGSGDRSWDASDAYIVGGFAQTGDDYLVMADADTIANYDVYSRVAGVWGTPPGIDLGSVAPESDFYAADGSLRIADGGFGATNSPDWYGYVDRQFFGNGTLGFDTGTSFDNGISVNRWIADDAAPLAATLSGVKGETGSYNVTSPDASNPIAVQLRMTSNANNYVNANTTSTTVDATSSTIKVRKYGTFATADNSFTSSTAGGIPGYNPDWDVDNFCSVGDRLWFQASAEDVNNQTLFTVTEIDAGSTNVIKFAEDVAAASNDVVYLINLSKTPWVDTFKEGITIGVTTLYGDEKQESKIVANSLAFHEIMNEATTELYPDEIGFEFSVFVGNGTSTGLHITHPRVSGFNVYLRSGIGSATGSDLNFYLYGTIDMSEGGKRVDSSTHSIWSASNLGGTLGTDTATTIINTRTSPTKLITYKDNTGFDVPPLSTAGIREIGVYGNGTGWKTSVVANRRAYIGNVTMKDSYNKLQHYGDAIFKSSVNKFDSFTSENRLEASIRDGDEIIKLEEYADRLLEFKKKKMTLINISQDIEFVEDTFMHKGVLHPAATCKTDFGVAWVNEQGCYLYDGQKVSNLLEKGGRQIIKESVWSTFVFNPMIGYIPKKRQLIVADDVGVDGSGAAYLYDMVTQSWVKAGAATFPDADSGDVKTNFVTDWNNDLIFAYNSDVGTVVKWDDTAATSTTMVMSTKDIDFGQPAQNKTVYKVIVTYQSSNATTNVQADYGVDGDTTFAYDFTVPELPAANGWQTAELVPDVQSEASNIKSFRLRFATDGTVPTGFEINDVSIVYRLKGQR